MACRADGYSRRCLPGDPKTNDRHRLLADRNAYIAFLEAQVERANEAALEAQSVGIGLRQIRTRVEELEDKARQTAQAVQVVQEHHVQAGDGARASQHEVEEQLRTMEGRVGHLERAVGEAHFTAEAEVSRLRNELSLAVQELGQKLDERARSFQALVNDGAPAAIREVQATCVRLADDAMSVAEASQSKVADLARHMEISQQRLEELARRTDMSLEVLRVDMTSARAELAGLSHNQAPLEIPNAHANAPVTMSPAPMPNTPTPAPMSTNIGEDAVNAIADAVEQRLAMRLGQQVLQLSDVLRRVVQAQVMLQRHCTTQPGGPVAAEAAAAAVAAAKSARPGLDSVAPGADFSVGGVTATGACAANEMSRQAAIDELYRELRELEDFNGSRQLQKRPPTPPRVARSRTGGPQRLPVRLR